MRRALSFSPVFGFFLYFIAGTAVAQTSNGTSASTSGPNAAERAIGLAESGHCTEAVTEYKKILDINPLLPGIHARLGRALLSEPQPTPETVAQAKKNFEDE